MAALSRRVIRSSLQCRSIKSASPPEARCRMANRKATQGQVRDARALDDPKCFVRPACHPSACII